MEAVEKAESAHPTKWLARLRLAAAVALIWAGLHYVVDSTVLSRGLERPVLVIIGGGVASGIAAAVVVLVVLLIGAFVGTLICGRRDATQGLLVVALGLAFWAFHGGTMDDWLIMVNQVAGPPTGAAYWPLLAEYAYWAVVVVAVLALGTRQSRAAGGGKTGAGWRGAFGFDASPVGLRDGITALIVSVAISLLAVLILSGPRVGHTYRGQVYFAVALAFIVGALVARRVTGAPGIIWYLPGPLIVGVVGVVLAAVKPGLGTGYEYINVIPAWGLVRPLPVEMIGVGTAAILLTLRAAKRLSSEEEQP